MARVATQGIRGIWRELRQIGMSGRQVWRLVPWRHRWALCGALLVMCLASAGNTAVAILILTFATPPIFFSALAGVLVDRSDKRLIMAAVNFGRACCIAGWPSGSARRPS